MLPRYALLQDEPLTFKTSFSDATAVDPKIDQCLRGQVVKVIAGPDVYGDLYVETLEGSTGSYVNERHIVPLDGPIDPEQDELRVLPSESEGDTPPLPLVVTLDRPLGETEWVNHPDHYNEHPSGVECIQIVRHMNFNLGSVVKYLWRAGLKEDQPTLRDLEKARFYLDDEIGRIKALAENQ